MSYAAMSLDDFSSQFSTQDACLDAIIRQRWPSGWICSHCHGSQCYRLRSRRALQCANRHCRAQVSVTTGTIFEQIKIPLPKVFLAMYLLLNRQHVTVKAVADQLAVAYNTAFDLLRKLRMDHEHVSALIQPTMPVQRSDVRVESSFVLMGTGAE